MDIIRVLSTELVNFLFIAVKNLNFVVAASGVGLGLETRLTLNKKKLAFQYNSVCEDENPRKDTFQHQRNEI